jgi:hypothetical protein
MRALKSLLIRALARLTYYRWKSEAVFQVAPEESGEFFGHVARCTLDDEKLTTRGVI